MVLQTNAKFLGGNVNILWVNKCLRTNANVLQRNKNVTNKGTFCNAFSFTNKQIFSKQMHVLQIIADILQTNANDLLMNTKVL